MKLSNIKITDFRSILSQEIAFNQNCLGLIGLNESGKSNVLSAIRLLDDKYIPTFGDRSKISRRFPKIECTFKLEEKDLQVIEGLKKNFMFNLTSSDKFELTIEPPTNIQKVIQIVQSEELLNRDISVKIPITVSTNAPLVKLKSKEGVPEDAVLPIGHESMKLSSIPYIEKSLLPEEFSDYFEEMSIDFIRQDFINQLHEIFKELYPTVIFWKYEEKYLLPSEIQYGTFIEGDNPYNNSAPLYNIFLLSKGLKITSVDELKDKIALWKNDASERRRDGAIITMAINAYIKKIWPDYDQELKIELEEAKITIHINDPNSQEMNFYSMEARSQGFKTFISFILTIAAEAENGIINNFILLLDEPETHLHPSGVRYMKEELLKLSEAKNYIVYSTHSIFMIDRKNLKRHIIVEKKNEITNLTKVERNNFIQEAVLYESMGTHLDEFSIPNKNIVVEGELDLCLLNYFISLYQEGELKQHIKDSQVWDGGGTSKIEKFFESKMLPASSIWTVIFDNDSPGQNAAKKLKGLFEKSANVKVSSFFYSEIQNYELEDILPRNLVQEAFNESIEKNKIQTTVVVDYSNETRPFSAITTEFIARNGVSKDQKNFLEQEFKNFLFNKISQILTDIDLEVSNDVTLNKKEAFSQRLKHYHDAVAKIILKPVQKLEHVTTGT
ncbi:MAG: AAA family ATPase [Chitinophagaceae bacterium]